ncbi:MAG: methyl-accepting chemotaxis protein [Desulfobulbaceae bacterium]
MEKKADDLLAIHEQLGRHLRETVFSLQKKYTSLPDFFTTDHNAQIADYLKNTFRITDSLILNGRDQYLHLYSRGERRDLAGGGFVIQEQPGALAVSLGLLDSNSNFTDSVRRITLRSDSPEQDRLRIQDAIIRFRQDVDNSDAFKTGLKELSLVLADEALKAEEARNEILYQVEKINAQEEALDAIRSQRERTTLLISLATLVINLLVLAVLTRTIVEKPLLKLTSIINEIRTGNFPDIPFADRMDQIGILAGAIKNFKEALLDLRKAEERKVRIKEEENRKKLREEQIIDELLENTTRVIRNLESKSTELVMLADSQHALAMTTNDQALRVGETINTTAENTTTVLESTREQKVLVTDIQQKIDDQNRIVQHIITGTHDSRTNIERLSQATGDINSIVGIVREITDQTRLLALNATIEAARAGEQGKSFGVVAAEVKMLSQQTARATGDIMVKIKAIGDAGAAMIANMRQIENNVAKMNEAGAHILDAVAKQEMATANISQRAIVTSENIMNVSRNIKEVTGAATKALDLSATVRTHSEDFAEEVSRLLSHTKEKLNLLAM